MTRLNLLLFSILVCSCGKWNTAPVDETSPYIYLREDTLNVLSLQDSAYVIISYPSGTAYYNYFFLDSNKLLTHIKSEQTEGNPEQAGGTVSSLFYFKAATKGTTMLKIKDRSHRIEMDTSKGALDHYYAIEVR